MRLQIKIALEMESDGWVIPSTPERIVCGEHLMESFRNYYCRSALRINLIAVSELLVSRSGFVADLLQRSISCCWLFICEWKSHLIEILSLQIPPLMIALQF